MLVARSLHTCAHAHRHTKQTQEMLLNCQLLRGGAGLFCLVFVSKAQRNTFTLHRAVLIRTPQRAAPGSALKPPAQEYLD